MKDDLKEQYIRARLLWGKIANSHLVKGANHHNYPARFARLHELKSILGRHGETLGGLLLGVGAFGRPLRVVPEKNRPELGNLAVIGRTRSGKGLRAKSQLLTWPHSAIVNDIKGDLFADTAGYRKTLGDVYVIDTRGFGHQYDPFMLRHSEEELLAIAEHLLLEPNEGEGIIFTRRAIKMLTQLCKAAKLAGERPLPYAGHLIHCGIVDAAEHLEAVSRKANLPPEKNLATRFLDVKLDDVNFDDRFLQSAWSTLTSKMEPILTETVLKSVSGSDFTAEDIMCGERPVTVYLRWPELHVDALAPLIRLIAGSLFDDFVTVYDERRGEGCRPIIWELDEAGRAPIAKLPELSATVAGRGISLVPSYQSRSQPDAIYGSKRGDIMWDNIDSVIYYRPAPTNQKTANTMQEGLGFKSAFAKSQTIHEGHATSEGESEQKIPLLFAWEIQRLKDNEIIGFHRNLPPFKAHRMDYRDFPVLMKRSKIPAPIVGKLPDVPAIRAVGNDTHTRPGFIDPDRRDISVREPSPPALGRDWEA